jgi:Mg2+-importing ATPase
MKLVNHLRNNFIQIVGKRFIVKTNFRRDPNLLEEYYHINRHDAPANLVGQLIKYAYVDIDDIFTRLESSEFGLSDQAVHKQRLQYGYNIIDKKQDVSWYKHLLTSYNNPFNVLLSVLGFVSFYTDDFTGGLVILTMVFTSTIIRFIQEEKSNRAIDRLKEMVSTSIKVLRQSDGINYSVYDQQTRYQKQYIELPIQKLVPGDIIHLSAGDLIPADVRVISAKDLFVSQASLTGESVPVEKFPKQSKALVHEALELENIGYMGTNVVSGTATAIVLATGKYTFFGSLADKLIQQENVSQNAFNRGINKVSWLLIYFMLTMSPIVFLINGFTSHGWRDAALFALSVAVGLTPEMLPMIVTTTLAKGAVFMSRQKVIIKRLDAIQSFGSMNVLCTDKTGTLTQDKICLAQHTDIFGEDCGLVLEYAYLNSYHQTGLKNLLDVAVLDKVAGDLYGLEDNFTKHDEIPFDFKRRRMSVVVTNNKTSQHILICKGAVEEMLSCCSYAVHHDKVMPLTPELLEQLKSVIADLNSDGLRVVAVAMKEYPGNDVNRQYTVADEHEMILVGYISFLDPPKETTHEALQALADLGINIKILTGDNDLVTLKICKEVGLHIQGILLGGDVDTLTDAELSEKIKDVNVFAKLSPMHKERIVNILKQSGNIVGFLGDGINDAAALRAADIGISVDTAVDIAKEASDIVLLEKSLLVLEHGVVEGRKTFANMMKYIKITASSNFGNVFSVLFASAFLPFLPMLPLQILLQNLIYDISQTVLPFDNVDEDFCKKPQTWNAKNLRNFMIFFGPISSVFDGITFWVLWNIFGANCEAKAPLFHTGWFIEGLITQTLIVHTIRTRKIPFIQSTASWQIILMTISAVSLAVFLPFSPLASLIGMVPMPSKYFIFLSIVVGAYMCITQLLKKVYINIYGWS